MINYKSFIIKCEVYPFDIMVYFGKSKKPLLKQLKSFVNVSKDEISEIKHHPLKPGTTFTLSGGQTVLYMPLIPSSTVDFAVLQHEIFHCVDHIMQKVGINYEPEGENEAYAYLIQYVTQKIYDAIF